MMQPVYINRTASIHAAPEAQASPWLAAAEPDYKEIIANATLRRRMSRIVKMGVACGLQCIDHLPAEEVDAIITATGLGCLADTEKFLNTLIENREQLLNPTPFIQSTFNTIGAQIALIRRIHAYNMTYVHRGLSFESALLDGMMSIREGKRHVLVGAVDEMTSTSYQIHRRLGLLRGLLPGEGAHFFLLEGERQANTLAALEGLSTQIRSLSAEETETWMLDFLSRHGLTPASVGLLLTGRTEADEADSSYAAAERLFPHACRERFKQECGEYATASAYALWRTLQAAGDGKPVLIYNRFHATNQSLILLRPLP